MKFGIVTDSSCDLPESYTAQEEVTVVSFYVSFDGENYLKEGKEAGITEFYQKMADNPDCYPKTSMPSVQDYIDAFLPVVKKGLPVLCICLTKNFSGSMQSAVTAKEEVEEEFPQAKIEVVNSQLVTGVGLMVPEFETFQEDLRKSLKEKGYHIETWETMQIGATIGVHTGPYPMGLGILKKCEI